MNLLKIKFHTVLVCLAAGMFLVPGAARARVVNPGCVQLTPQQCVALAIDAMGGRERLQQLKSVRLTTVGHTLLMEQSYRQAPFITSYERAVTTLDLSNERVLVDTKVTWPEADANQSDYETTWVAGFNGGVNRARGRDFPASPSQLETARQMLALGPARLLLTASAAPDLRFAPPEDLRSTAHTVVAFTCNKVPVRVLLNSFNHLPDALETTQQFHDFWYFWGDVQQRIYFDNWKATEGVIFPTNLVEERNGALWRSTQALNLEFNVPIDEKSFAMDAEAAKKSQGAPGWDRPFNADHDTALTPGIDLFLGAWNSTIIKQPDGLVILEAPISGLYTQGVIEEAKRRYPGMAIKAVVSTSDSWPHTGGVRFAVSRGMPIYILDLNRPLLDRMMSAPHTVAPDALSQHPARPRWKIVAQKVELGGGQNRMELYPLRGASTERQYMVYFPQQHLLYASDTLALNQDGSLYDPELMREVAQAVQRENLKVDTVFAMHQGPMAWSAVLALLQKSQQP